MIAAPSIPFVVRFPEGHEHAGQIIGRSTVCSRCGREFKQYKVNPDWVQSLSDGAQKAFLVSCEMEKGSAYQPARCPVCTRAQLNPEVEYAPIL
jgi:hypothetical protein